MLDLQGDGAAGILFIFAIVVVSACRFAVI